MEWTNVNDSKPQIIEKIDTWGKSAKVVVLVDDKDPFVAEYNKGIEDGVEWEQWYCPAYEDIIENVTKWSDCIPNYL